MGFYKVFWSNFAIPYRIVIKEYCGRFFWGVLKKIFLQRSKEHHQYTFMTTGGDSLRVGGSKSLFE